MRREQVEIEAPSIGGAGTVIGYGHYGRPVLLFPAEQGRAWDLEGAGMIDAVAVRRPVGAGVSLGALAMLHAQRRFPDVFAGLLLQSGSFFMPRFDAHESGFPRYQRIVRFVRAALSGRDAAEAVPVVLTCGTREENIHDNRVMAHALGAPLHECADTHNYTAWRDAFDPHLTGLLERLW